MPATEVSQLVSTGPGFPVHLWGAAELHATFLEESRTSLFSASVVVQEIRGVNRPFRGFLSRKTTPATLIGPQYCETALDGLQAQKSLSIAVTEFGHVFGA